MNKIIIDQKREIFFIVFIFILALFLRIAYLSFLSEHYFFFDHPGSDVPYYQQWAHEIIQDNWIGHQIFYGMPLYPYFLAILKCLTLGNPFLIRIAHLILG